MLRIHRSTVLDGHRLRLTLTNGDVVERDIGALLWEPVFEPLRPSRRAGGHLPRMRRSGP
jgi:hypothetical protein